jgi:transaldolase
VDPLLEPIIAQGGQGADLAKGLRGQVAIASAKLAYQNYKELFGTLRFNNMAEKGARPQRLLWASTGTKNPAYCDVKYIEALIGADTVNTVPKGTLDAYRDHGVPKANLEKDLDEAARELKRLPALGIDIDQVTQQLEDEGVAKFNQPFDRLVFDKAKRKTKTTKGTTNEDDPVRNHDSGTGVLGNDGNGPRSRNPE